MFALIASLYVRLIQGLAALAALLILFSIGLVIVSVVWRFFGLGAVQATIATVEYILLYFTILSAPYLLHTGGHVAVDMIVSKLTGTPRRLLESAIYIIGIVVCAIFTVVSVEIILDALRRNSFDERSVDVPYWLLYAGYPLCFGLLTIEFARYLFSGDSLYESQEPKDGL
jgi:TRAP-type C4-dicarboxylate transport system permease small subunit